MNNYIEPEFNVVLISSQDVIATSMGGEDFNTLGDQPDRIYYKNSNWTIEL